MGAVSLSFDDGLRSQIELAMPILGDYGLRSTFYINPPASDDETVWRPALAPWREAARNGHEIGNHSLTHPCSQNYSWMAGRMGLERMSMDDIERDVLAAEERLRVGVPEQSARSYCYPCYQSDVGAGATRRSYVPLIARHFIAARSRGTAPNDPVLCDLHMLTSWPGERMTGAELVGLAERAASEQRWTIFTFHGINEGDLPVAEADLRELCGFLARAPAHLDRIHCIGCSTHRGLAREAL